VPISSDDDTDSTGESNREFDAELYTDLDMRIEDNVDAEDGVDLDGDVDLKRDSDNEGEEHEQDEDEEEEDEDEDDGKEPLMIGQGEMINTSADDVDTMLDHEPIVLPEQGQEMCKKSPRPQPPAPAPRIQAMEPPPLPRTPEIHLLSRLEYLGLMTPQKPHPAVPTLREAEAAGNTSDVDVHQQLLIDTAGGNSLSDVPLPDTRPDDLVGKEVTCPGDAEGAMVVAFG
jgi:hypothetical protein